MVESRSGEGKDEGIDVHETTANKRLSRQYSLRKKGSPHRPRGSCSSTTGKIEKCRTHVPPVPKLPHLNPRLSHTYVTCRRSNGSSVLTVTDGRYPKKQDLSGTPGPYHGRILDSGDGSFSHNSPGSDQDHVTPNRNKSG